MTSENRVEKEGDPKRADSPTNKHPDYSQPAVAPIPTELQSPQSPVRNVTSDQERKNWQENVRFWFEGIGLFVLIVYTTLAALQWHQMKRATDLAQKANADAWTLANRANQTAIDSERPWVGISYAIQDWEVNKFPSATVFFINSGRRPAKVTLVQFDKRDYEVFPNTPSYSRNSTDVKSVALILPNGTLTNTQPIGQLHKRV